MAAPYPDSQALKAVREAAAHAERALQSAQTQFQMAGVIANRTFGRRRARLRQPQDALSLHLLMAT